MTSPGAATTGAAALRVEDLHAGYGPVTVLHGVTLECRPGQILGVTGPNGAGKSTLLNAIAGTISPSRGRIVLAGAEVQRRAPHLRVRDGLALVPEGRQVIGSLSVAHNLDVTVMARRRLSLDGEHRRRVREMLDLFPRLEDRLGVAASSLSGGEQQMLAISRALMTRPRVLLLDEPSQGLSVNVVALVVEALRRLRGTVSMVIVEHNADVLAELADEVVHMSMGRVRRPEPSPAAPR